MPYTPAQLEAEAIREHSMRLQVYPGRVTAGKMTQKSAEKKTRLMKEIATVVHVSILKIALPALPIYEPDGNPAPITDLDQHIKEAQTEINWRAHRLKTHVLSDQQRRKAEEQLEIMKEIASLLQKIQSESGPQQEQLSLF